MTAYQILSSTCTELLLMFQNVYKLNYCPQLNHTTSVKVNMTAKLIYFTLLSYTFLIWNSFPFHQSPIYGSKMICKGSFMLTLNPTFLRYFPPSILFLILLNYTCLLTPGKKISGKYQVVCYTVKHSATKVQSSILVCMISLRYMDKSSCPPLYLIKV